MLEPPGVQGSGGDVPLDRTAVAPLIGPCARSLTDSSTGCWNCGLPGTTVTRLRQYPVVPLSPQQERLGLRVSGGGGLVFAGSLRNDRERNPQRCRIVADRQLHRTEVQRVVAESPVDAVQRLADLTGADIGTEQ